MIFYAFRVPPQREFVAREILQRQGYRPFVPVERKIRRRTRSNKKVHEREYPLLLGYVLVPLASVYDIGALFRLEIIKSVVGFGGVPAPISDKALETIRKLSGQAVPHVTSVNMRQTFAEGDTVLISDGPFRGNRVRVEAVVGHKARIILDLFNARQAVDIRLESLEPA